MGLNFYVGGGFFYEFFGCKNLLLAQILEGEILSVEVGVGYHIIVKNTKLSHSRPGYHHGYIGAKSSTAQDG